MSVCLERNLELLKLYCGAKLRSMYCSTTQMFLCSHITGLLHDFLSREEDGMSSQLYSAAREQKEEEEEKRLFPGI